MATKKAAPAEEQPEVTQEVAEQAQAEAENALQAENKDLKAMLKDMQAMMLQMQTQLTQQQEQIRKMAAGEIAPERPKTQSDIDRENVRKIAEEAAAEGKDPWTIEVEVFVPHREKGEDKWYWVNINDRPAQIPADDRRQKMKLPFALVLMDMIKAKQQEDDFIDSIVVYDPKDNPHDGRP